MRVLWPLALALGLIACAPAETADEAQHRLRTTTEELPMSEIPTTDDSWQQKLTDEEYHILRQKGTERAFSGPYWDHKAAGRYRCAGCGALLFTSATKFDSGTGWPSFFDPATPQAIAEHQDRSHGMVRTEATCARCGGHLGHVFTDGPAPSGLRYCINGHALRFEAE